MKQKGKQVDEANGEKETKMTSTRRKKLLQKLEKIKMQRCFNQFSGWPSTGYEMSTVYELKLRKLKANNKALAKALADQKLETQQWYREVITLKSELQEIQERLLRTTNDDFEAAVEHEVEKQLREHCEPISAAISTAMENVVVVVESLTKAKQVTGGVLKSCRKRSSCSSRNSSSSNSFPRTSGSRLPLGPSGSNEPPRLSVLPMVSGHVLQPAMVAIPKLDVIWSRKVKERIQAREEEGLDMSTIGEQSSTIEDEERSPSQRQNEAETTKEESNTSLEAEEGSDFSDSQPDNSIPGDDTEVKRLGSIFPMQPKASSRTRNNIPQTELLDLKSVTPGCSKKAESQRQGKPSKGTKALMNKVAGESPTTSREVSPLVSSVQEDIEMKQEKNVPSVKQTVTESEEDPLEGSSWWYADVSRKRSSYPSRAYAKRARQSKQKTRVECPSWQSHGSIVLESSSDSENDSLDKVSKSIRSSGKAPKEPSQSASSAKASPEGTLDHSYVASPTTMLTKLEDLEARVGRRSKSRSKGRSQRTNTDTLNRVSEIEPANHSRRTRRSHELLRSTDELICLENNSESNTLRLNEIDTDTDLQTSNEFHHKDTILMPPPNRILPDQRIDFLITDNDLTCVHDVSMEMTESLSKIISQAIPEDPKEDEKNKKVKGKQTQPERRFFKAHSPESSESKSAVPEKTPFDVSLMDATVVDIPPYSSKKNIEKENLPPESDYVEDKKSLSSPSLRRLSIVLQDVMKSPDTLRKFTVTADVSPSSGSENLGNGSGRSTRHKSNQQSINESPKGKKKIKRRKLTFCVKATEKEEDEDSDEDEDDEDEGEDLWIPSGNKKKNSKQKRKSFGKMQMRNSDGGKKRISVINTVTEPLKKRHKRKTSGSDDKISVGTSESNPIIIDEEEFPNKVTQQEKRKTRTKYRNLECENVSSSCLKECYVRIQQTNLKDIKEYTGNPEENGLLSVSTILPLKLNTQEELNKQMESVREKALKMRMEQSVTSGNGLELSADKEQLQKQHNYKEEGVEDSKEEEEGVKYGEEEWGEVNEKEKEVKDGEEEGVEDGEEDGVKDGEEEGVKDVKGEEGVKDDEEEEGVKDDKEEEGVKNDKEEEEDEDDEKEGFEDDDEEGVKDDKEEEGVKDDKEEGVKEDKEEGVKDDKEEEEVEGDKEEEGVEDDKEERVEKEGAEDDKEKNDDDDMSQCEKNSTSKQEEKDDLKEKRDHIQLEEKEDMQKDEQHDSLPKIHVEVQKEPHSENIQKNYHNNKKQEQPETLKEDISDEIQQGESHKTLKEESCNATQERVQKEKEKEGQIKKGSETVVVVLCNQGDQEENSANNNLNVDSDDVRDSTKKEDNEDCIMEIRTTEQKGTETDSKKESDEDDIGEVQQPRKRRAALKVTSFKELSLNSKLRQRDGTMVIGTTVKRKSVRKSTAECT